MNWKNYLKESSDKPVVPFIVGPTATGKTKLAIEMADQLDGEIISADSMQIYKYMTIGTAKPTPEEQEQAVHHMIDIIRPDQDYSVADYYKDASPLITDILERGKTPIICGGTGLYIKALSQPMAFDMNTVDNGVRSELEKIALTPEGSQELWNRLNKVDPESAKIIHPNNIKRVIRALEIYEVTGKPKSLIDYENSHKELLYQPALYAPDMDRQVIYSRINDRVDQMIDMGLIDEVKNLDLEFGRNIKSMQALGYKEFYPYLDGEKTLEECVEILKRDTRRFAKRQLTWFRADKRIEYFSPIS